MRRTRKWTRDNDKDEQRHEKIGRKMEIKANMRTPKTKQNENERNEEESEEKDYEEEDHVKITRNL